MSIDSQAEPRYPSHIERDAVRLVEAVGMIMGIVADAGGRDYSSPIAKLSISLALPVLKSPDSFALLHPESTDGKRQRKVLQALIAVVEQT